MHYIQKLGSLGQAPRKFQKISLCKIESESNISGYFTLADLCNRVTVYVHGIANNLIIIIPMFGQIKGFDSSLNQL